MASVLEATTKADFVSRLKTVILSSGFETFMIGVERRTVNGAPERFVTSDYAPQWQIKYQQCGYELIDPTVPYCLQSTNPLVWDEDFFKGAGAMHLLEEARVYGISHGLSIAIHDRSGDKCMLSLVRDKPLDVNKHEKARLLASARLISACIHHMGFQLLGVDEKLPDKALLTQRELEILQWVALGKTTWEISAILSIVEATVAFHIKNVMRKLDVHNRQQALAVALRMGLIN